MPIFLDSQPLAAGQIGPKATVAELLENVKTKLSGGRIILGLRCDDEDVDTQRLPHILPRPAGSFKKLELVTGLPEGMVLDTLEYARRAFCGTFATVQEAITAVSAGNLADAMTHLAECVGIWGQTHEAVVAGGRLLEVDFERLEIGGRPVLAWLGELAVKLRELKQAIELRDPVLLGDILRYELDDTLRAWEQMLDGFIAHVSNRACAA